jgi:hypothetical protein
MRGLLVTDLDRRSASVVSTSSAWSTRADLVRLTRRGATSQWFDGGLSSGSRDDRLG